MTNAPPFTLTDAEEEDLTEIEREALEDGEAWWTDGQAARRIEVNRSVIAPLLRPEDRTARGIIHWRRLSTTTGIPVSLLKRWWWGEEAMSFERIEAIRAHELSIGRRTDEPTEYETPARERTGSRKPPKHVDSERLQECRLDSLECSEDDGDRPLLSFLLSEFL